MDQETEYTEAELTGEAETVTEPEPATEEKAETPPGDSAIPEEAAPEKEPEPVKEPEAAKEPEKPSKEEDRMVPKIELIRERKNLQGKIENLEREMASLRQPEKDPSELILEDPEQAVVMLGKQIQDLRESMARTEMERRIQESVPDFLEVAPKMEAYLTDLGFEDNEIRDMIGAAGDKVPQFFKLLADRVKTPDEKSLREQVAAELTPKITEEVTKVVMAKLNIASGPTDIGKLPGAGPTGKVGDISEADYAKLSPEDQERWLTGEL